VVTLYRDGRSVDPVDLLLLTLCVLLVVRARAGALATTLALAALVRESWIFVLPFAYVYWARRPLDAAAGRTTLAVAAPATAAYVAIRLGMPTTGRAQVVGYSGAFLAARWDVVTAAVSHWGTKLRRCFLALGPLWFVAPFAVPRLRLARAGLAWLALTAVALLFAADWGRVLFVLAPVAYPASAYVLRARTRLSWVVLAACLCCNAAYLAYMVDRGAANILHPAPPTYPVH
jgi:hypothetical protein